MSRRRSRIDEICRAISKFDAHVRTPDVARVLGPLFDNDDDDNSNTTTTTNNNTNDDDTVDHEEDSAIITPLLLACDKAQVHTVVFLRQQQKPHLTGRVSDPAPDSGNTAVHHACMSDDPALLQALLLLQPSDSKNDKDDTLPPWGKMNHHNNWHTLINAHGDTPLMMAAMYNCEQLLRYVLPTIVSSQDDNDIIDGLSLRNASNDSAISLAACHGHVGALQTFLSLAPAAAVHAADLQKATAALQHTEQLLLAVGKQKQPPPQQEKIRTKQKQIQQCVQMLTDVLQQRADAWAAKLVATETTSATSTPKKPAKGKRKQPKRRQHQPQQTIQRDDDDKSNAQQPQQKEEWTTSQPKKEELVRLKKLDNGTHAVVVPGRMLGDEAQEEEEAIIIPQQQTPPSCTRRTVDDLFPNQIINNNDQEAKLRMQALCVEPAQLLLTAHGMALHLSASQLDAVEWVLERQLQTVLQARGIQTRLHNTARQTTTQ